MVPAHLGFPIQCPESYKMVIVVVLVLRKFIKVLLFHKGVSCKMLLYLYVGVVSVVHAVERLAA